MATRPVLALFLALILVPTAAAQTTRIGPMLGYNTDAEEFTLGLNAHVGMNFGDREVLAGVVAELFPFLDGGTITMIDVDALLPGRVGSLGLYGGGGLTVRYLSVEGGPSDTDVGLNLKGGVTFESEVRSWTPFVELVQTIGAGTDLTARAGVYFVLGR